MIMSKLKVVFMLLMISMAVFARKNDSAGNAEWFAQKWKQVDRFDEKGLPRSADSVVMIIHQRAVDKQDAQHALKSLLRHLGYQNDYTEWSELNDIKDVEAELQKSWQPYSQLLHLAMAQKLANYYQSHSYEMRNLPGDSLVVEKMNPQQLIAKIQYHTHQSLENEKQLAAIKASDFSEIVVKGNRPQNLRPTLYDIIAWQVIDFYTQNSLMWDAENAFQLSDSLYFADASTFVSLPVNKEHQLANSYQIVKTLQKILAFRLTRTSESEALVAADLDRLIWVSEHYRGDEKDSHFQKALTRLLAEASGKPIWSKVQYHLAYLKYYSDSDAKRIDISEVVRMLEKGISAYPKSEGGMLCQQLLSSIKAPYIDLTTEEIYVANQPSIFQVTPRNCTKLYGYIISVPFDTIPENRYNRSLNTDSVMVLLKQSKNRLELPLSTPQFTDYRSHAIDMQLPSLKAGRYILVITNQPATLKKDAVAFSEFQVSSLALVSKQATEAGAELRILNRTTGLPVEGAKVEVRFMKYYPTMYGKRQVYYSDSQGVVCVLNKENDRTFYASISLNGDTLISNSLWQGLLKDNEKEPSRYLLDIFTDRRIYRPGQTIFYKAVLTNTNGKDAKVVAKQNVDLRLRDVNGNELQKVTLTTNDFGSCSGTFQIPTGLLTGDFAIISQFGSVTFRVEEYKRPKFAVELTGPEDVYRLGDTITVKGVATSFTGATVSNSQVRYRISRRQCYIPYPFKCFPGFSNDEEMKSDTTFTNDKGEFSIRIATAIRSNYPDEQLNYVVETDVTDINGETQSKSLSLTIGKKGYILEVIVPERLVLAGDDSLVVNLKSTNLNGHEVVGTGKYSIYRLMPFADVKPVAYWNTPEVNQLSDDLKNRYYYPDKGTQYDSVLVASGTFDTSKSKVIRHLNPSWLKASRYKMIVELNSDKIRQEKIFSAVTYEDRESCDAEPLQLSLIEPDSLHANSRILISSAFRDAHCWLDVTANGRRIYNSKVDIGKLQKIIELKVGSELPVRLSAQGVIILNNRLYRESAELYLPEKDKSLHLKLETFRDKLTPATQETVTLHVDKQPVEVLASMYDASLDQWQPNQWNFDLFYQPWYSAPNADIDGFGRGYGTFNWYGEPSFNQFWSNGYICFSGFGSRVIETTTAISSVDYDKGTDDVAVPVARIAEETVPGIRVGNGSSKKKMMLTGAVSSVKIELSAPSTANVSVRKALQETAFFYPHLMTNADGSVTFTYTVPESLTKWRMMMLAHNKDGLSGQLERYLTTSKELMVVPEIPRFVREGDQIVFNTKVTNLTNKALEASATLEILDAMTLKPIEGCERIADQKVSIKAMQSASAEWPVNIPKGIEAIVIRVKAASAIHSDGEEQIIPVLPSRVMVSESLPFQMVKAGKYEYHLKNLEKAPAAIESHRLTFSYTQNASWEVLKALPYLMEYPYECSEQVFSRLFGYTMGQTLIEKNPTIKQALELWALDDKNGGKALQSPLLKNESLKQLLAEETPWQNAGENETANRRRLLQLLDENQTNEAITRAISKLETMYAGNGGFVWFKGMAPSSYITAHLVAGFGQLKKAQSKVVEFNRVDQMIDNGLGFLQDELNRDWSDRVKDSLAHGISSDMLHSLYALSYFPEKLRSYQQAARNEMIDTLANTHKYSSITEQAIAAMVLHRFGRDEAVKGLLNSLIEREIRNDDLTQVWFCNNSGWYWYDNKIEAQAVVLEAFNEIIPAHPHIAAMQNWLVFQKRAQAWPTTRSTVMAIAGMMTSNGFQTSTGKVDGVKVGSVNVAKLPDVRKEAMTGSYSVTWNKESVKSSMGQIVINKTEDTPSWGSLSWQYFTSINNVKSTGSVLKVDKAMLVERIVNGKTTVLPLEKVDAVVGDKIIVRLTLTATESMDYVHLKDLRSALLEPVDVISTYHYQYGLGYYQSVRDAAVNFFIGHIGKGTYVLEYELRVRGKGVTANGFASVQCMYAPEFESRSESCILRSK